jgi:hypothetical protein
MSSCAGLRTHRPWVLSRRASSENFYCPRVRIALLCAGMKCSRYKTAPAEVGFQAPLMGRWYCSTAIHRRVEGLFPLRLQPNTVRHLLCRYGDGSLLPWWEKVRMRGKSEHTAPVATFHPLPGPLPSRERGGQSRRLSSVNIYAEHYYLQPSL